MTTELIFLRRCLKTFPGRDIYRIETKLLRGTLWPSSLVLPAPPVSSEAALGLALYSTRAAPSYQCDLLFYVLGHPVPLDHDALTTCYRVLAKSLFSFTSQLRTSSPL